MTENFELEPSIDPLKEAINLVNQVTSIKELKELARKNTIIGYKFNPLLFEHLKDTEDTSFQEEFSGYNLETGYLQDIGKQDTTLHVTEYEPSVALSDEFYEKTIKLVIELLQTTDEDLRRESLEAI